MTVALPTLLADLVDTSQRVGAQASRRAKIAAIADLLRKLAPMEIEIAVSWLAGITRQGRSGVGYALIRDARPAANVESPELTLIEVDATLAGIAATGGPGSVTERTRLLSRLFARATQREQQFLERLLIGELRQGALEGIMIEAVAAAAGLPSEAVRRAAKIGGGIVAVAADALYDGRIGQRLRSLRGHHVVQGPAGVAVRVDDVPSPLSHEGPPHRCPLRCYRSP